MSGVFPESLEVHRRTFLDGMRLRNYSPATLGSQSGSLDVFFGYLMRSGVDDMREVTREMVRGFHLWMIESGRYKVSTVHVRIIALRRFFEHLERADAVLVNPCLGLRLPRLERQPPRKILTPSEVNAILNAPNTQTRKGVRDRAILEMFYSTGLRCKEMASLTVYDVDYQAGFVRVNKGKSAKDRVVPMGRKASDYLREYLVKVRSEWSRENREERALWLSSIRPHQAIDKQAVEVMVNDYAKKAGIGWNVRPHVWRHTCATHLVAGGANIAYIQRLLGHRSLASTQIYTRVAPMDVKKTFQRAHPSARIKRSAATAIKPRRLKGAYRIHETA